MNISPSALLAIVVATTIANVLILVMVSLRSKNSRSRRLAAVETMLSTSYFEGGSSQPRPIPPSDEQDPSGDPSGDPPEPGAQAIEDGSNGIEPTGSGPHEEAWVTMERVAYGVESGTESADTEHPDAEANDRAMDADRREAGESMESDSPAGINADQPEVGESMDADSPVAAEEPSASEEPVMANDPFSTEEPVVTDATEEPGAIEQHVVTDQFVWTWEPAIAEEPALTEEPVASEEPFEEPSLTEEPVASEEPFEEPALTEEPVMVNEPVMTEEPVMADEPVATEEPVDAAVATGSMIGRDGLTMLLDANSFNEVLAHEAAREQRYGRPATVVVFELDGLSKIVDRLGPNTGDRIEVALTDTIARLARRADYVARLEPGRYGALLPETDEIAAINYVERIRRAGDLWLESGAIAMRLAIGWASTGGDVQPGVAMRTATDRMRLELRQNLRMVGDADAATDPAVSEAVGPGGSDLAVNGL